MVVTRAQVAQQIKRYLHHEISIAKLVEWAEHAMQEAALEEGHEDEITQVLSRLGMSDVKNFELMWEDYEGLLNTLGYKVHLHITPNS
jgi:hypothetical protein